MGRMRDSLFESDSHAVLKVALPSPEQAAWIGKVLSDAALSRARVATASGGYTIRANAVRPAGAAPGVAIPAQ
jgi:hypothetical protein